jgi:hypothetical protein
VLSRDPAGEQMVIDGNTGAVVQHGGCHGPRVLGVGATPGATANAITAGSREMVSF